MNRSIWKFSYTADKLLTAANSKIDFHKGRLDWWAGKQIETKEKIKSEGIEIDESVAFDSTFYSNNSSIGRGPSVGIRHDLVKDLSECAGKVAEHRSKIKEYEAWAQVLASQGQSTLELHQDDWLFFFGK